MCRVELILPFAVRGEVAICMDRVDDVCEAALGVCLRGEEWCHGHEKEQRGQHCPRHWHNKHSFSSSSHSSLPVEWKCLKMTQVNAAEEKATILHHQSTATTREGPDGHKDDTATGSARTHNLAFQLTPSCKITAK